MSGQFKLSSGETLGWLGGLNSHPFADDALSLPASTLSLLQNVGLSYLAEYQKQKYWAAIKIFNDLDGQLDLYIGFRCAKIKILGHLNRYKFD